jgi:hypothetical protein
MSEINRPRGPAIGPEPHAMTTDAPKDDDAMRHLTS